MLIRPAKIQDAEALASLIQLAAGDTLQALLTVPHASISEFLRYALGRSQGQFGYGNHWVVCDTNPPHTNIWATGCTWHTNMQADFQLATLHTLLTYFGHEKALHIVQNNALLEDLVKAPLPHQLSVGHFAVAPNMQTKGVGRRLLDHFVELAKQTDKQQLCLDVAQNNHNAIAFYQHYGFIMQSTSAPRDASASKGFSPHCHMVFSI